MKNKEGKSGILWEWDQETRTRARIHATFFITLGTFNPSLSITRGLEKWRAFIRQKIFNIYFLYNHFEF